MRTARRPEAVGGGQAGRSRRTSRAGLSSRRPTKTVWRSKPPSDQSASRAAEERRAASCGRQQREVTAHDGQRLLRKVSDHERRLVSSDDDGALFDNALAGARTCRPELRRLLGNTSASTITPLRRSKLRRARRQLFGDGCRGSQAGSPRVAPVQDSWRHRP